MAVYVAGLRLNEACHLQAKHLDLARQQIRIVQGKGRKDRYALLSPRLLAELRANRRRFRPQHRLFPATRTPEQPMVGATGQRIYYHAVQRAGLRSKGGSMPCAIPSPRVCWRRAWRSRWCNDCRATRRATRLCCLMGRIAIVVS
jgi:integrase